MVVEARYLCNGGLEERATGWCWCWCCFVDRGTDGDRGMGRMATLAGSTGAAAEGGSMDDLHSIIFDCLSFRCNAYVMSI
jgi:hypothetical protein